ncbi:sensor histidine kinase [Streptomonospora nanhaiensis]|uniref:histidine kinase n=3 Tax=Streptomonospora nanhaiensis TaxID=1323731 RepID=A0A853BKJ0_9ACTN|nr:nitrate- and nitrite sensing domain-containing protein [Streptomonospora nanhaiensis]MBV2362151.1 nitrate- and nitrite sensing domain-containing protein [Streptomonospora nanhaiensis]MBV2364777.1 nitrate- and nitrite sensing domain-containing protein [Streptomonospora nanhaiensis]NYI96018.1 signal transduction histidine kinase [Streptomonospora nanhaiensis]
MESAKRKRRASIRRRSRRAVLLPAAAFVALWLTVSSYLVLNAFQMVGAARALDELSTPAAVSLVSVMDERSQTVAYLENPEEFRAQLEETRRESDKLTQEVFDRFEPFRDLASDAIRQRIADFESQYRGIDDIRAEVDEGTASREEVLRDYNRVMTVAANLFDEQSRGHPEPTAIGPGLSATNTFRVVDLLAQSDAQLTRSFANGSLTHEDQHEFTRLSSSYHAILDSIRPFMSDAQTAKLETLMESEDYQRLVEYEQRIVDREIAVSIDPVTGEETRDTTVPVSEREWREVYVPVKDALTDIGASESYHAADLQTRAATLALSLALGGTLGVALLGFAAISIAVRTTNSVVTRLGRLRDETDQRANEFLPELAERLRRNEPVDSTAIPPLTASDDEIGEVATAFDKAQRFAVDAAVRQAELLHGINRVFLNIAHRSQTLIHRQLRLLDRMEREQEDPEQLTELFKLDHLATRSRRNAENLLILGGENPGRTWHRPMPLVDVLRGAISESGDYTRVDRQQIARVSLKGPAVADVIHLVAELVDNATTFSPPHSQVRLSSEQVPNGVVVEIEDRGLGMQEDEFEAANDILANPPEFDVMRLNEKMRLGLFVVSRLAKRHDIKVRLRSSPYGGVQAIVLLPAELIATEHEIAAAASSDTGERALPGAGERAEGAEHAEGTAESGAARAGAAPREDAPAGDMLAGRGAAPSGAAEAADPPTTGALRRGDGLTPAEAGHTATGLPRRAAPGGEAGGGARADVLSGPAPGGRGAHARRTAPAPAANGAHTGTGTGTGTAGPAAGGNGSGGGAPRGDSRPPLPKRNPQTHLAPQLHQTPPSAYSTPAAPAMEEEDRSERLRRNMAAFQQGTRRGRLEGQQRQNDSDKDSRP